MIQIGGGHPKPFDPGLLFHLADCLREDAEEAEDGTWITKRIIENVAEFEDAPIPACYAALAFAPDLQIRREHAVSIEVCLSNCQMAGAVKTLERLLGLQTDRAIEDKAGFDLLPGPCFDQCDFGPVLRSIGPNGTFIHRNATSQEMAALVDAVCD